MGKHSSHVARQSVTKAALVGGAAVTAAAMTVGMAAPSANAAAATPNPVQDAVGSAINIGKGVGQSGLFLVEGVVAQPINAAELAAAIAQGKDAQVAYLIQATIDGPLWVAKPTFDALIKELPAPLGGENGLVNDLYVRAWEVRQEVRKLVLGTDENVPASAKPDVAALLKGAVDQFVAVSEGLGTTGLRTAEAVALQPVVAVLLAGAVVQGQDDVVDYLVQQEIDGPLWAADPTFKALRDNLPAPLGKDDGLVWGVREQAYDIRQAVRKLAGHEETLSPPAGLPDFLRRTPDTQETLTDTSGQQQRTLNTLAGAQQNESLAQASEVPASTRQTTTNTSVFNLSPRTGNSSETEGRKPLNDVRTQLRTAAENTQNEINTAVTNAAKRFNNAVGNLGNVGRHSSSGSDASASQSSAGTGSTANSGSN